MKRLLLSLSFLLAILALLIPASSAFAQSVHVEHPKQHAIPLATCLSAPSDGNCDNKDPFSEGCNADERIIHTSGWFTTTNILMGTTLWRSDRCRTIWGETSNNLGQNVTIRSGVAVFPEGGGGHGWWTGCISTSDLYSPMAFASSAFDADDAQGQAQAIDCGNNSEHTTPKYSF